MILRSTQEEATYQSEQNRVELIDEIINPSGTHLGFLYSEWSEPPLTQSKWCLISYTIRFSLLLLGDSTISA